MDSRNKRIFKLLSLLLSSLFIGIASAYTYNMFMNATVGVKASGMTFVANSPDYATCTGSITPNKQSVTFTTMDGLPDQEIVYMPVNIRCADASGHHIELKVDTWDGALQANLNSITVTMYNGATKEGASIVLYPTGGGTSITTTGIVPIADGNIWNVEWKVYWKSTAAVGVDSVHVNLLLVVAD